MTIDQRRQLGFVKLGDLQEHARANCRALYLCRHIATASKHWSVSQHPDPNVRVVVSRDEAGWGAHFVDDGKDIAADFVFEHALEFWTGFIYGNQVAKASAVP